jgi:hypothetical protein
VTIGTPTVVQGNIEPSILTEKLSELHPILDGCYVEALSRNHRAEGAIEMRLTADGSRVRANTTVNTVDDTALTGCVRQAVGTIQLEDLVRRGRPVETDGDTAAAPGAAPTFIADWSITFTQDE